jgi:hypothetical protein
MLHEVARQFIINNVIRSFLGAQTSYTNILYAKYPLFFFKEVHIADKLHFEKILMARSTR